MASAGISNSTIQATAMSELGQSRHFGRQPRLPVFLRKRTLSWPVGMSGLKEGDKVVLNVSSQIASGMKVDPHELSHRPAGK